MESGNTTSWFSIGNNRGQESVEIKREASFDFRKRWREMLRKIYQPKLVKGFDSPFDQVYKGE